MQRSIVHMDLDAFFVSCEVQRDNRLSGIPLIIGGGSDRGVVASCSYEARKFGVHSAMPMRQALFRCPDAKIIKGDMDFYSKMSNTVTEIIEGQAPVIEKASIDEFYLDVSGMDKFFGCYKWTNELVKTITRETGLPMSFALSVNKTVSKIGTGESKPKGHMEIPSSCVKSFLNPLPVYKIPGVGEKTSNLLSRTGIRTIHTLSEVPVEMLHRMFGQNGIELWKKANGIDNTPVQPYREQKSISTERTFEQDTIDIRMVKDILTGMVERLCFQLRSEDWLVTTVTIRIRYANFDTETKQCKVQSTSCDHALIRTVMLLFDKHYNRRMRIRLVGVRFSGLVRGKYQINIFEDTAEKISLYQAIDKIKRRFGSDAVGLCNAMIN
ncbi:DNA polymerase IV [Flavobacterium sp.]|uniref:DNA polymerase IV n=1 Tax=Flavobacterium sp. TaxID=239 RepID=UPI00122601D8|nr:DNA polymerase IV [Flavobacterium sp.]RZJ71760.1 MAG: DNA polymerase IV [Flavobacterium sp.]